MRFARLWERDSDAKIDLVARLLGTLDGDVVGRVYAAAIEHDARVKGVEGLIVAGLEALEPQYVLAPQFFVNPSGGHNI